MGKYENISFDLIISRKLYEYVCAPLLEKISIIRSGVLVFQSFNNLFQTKKKRREDVVHESSLLLNTLLVKSNNFIKDVLTLEHSNYFKIDYFKLDWNKKNPF